MIRGLHLRHWRLHLRHRRLHLRHWGLHLRHWRLHLRHRVSLLFACALCAVALTAQGDPALDARLKMLENELRCLRPTAWLVDTSRGGVVDSAALHRALAEGRLAGAALDVLDPEPPASDSPLLQLPNVVLSPHCAGITRAAYRRLALAAARDIESTLRGERPAGLVGPVALWASSRAAAHRSASA